MSLVKQHFYGFYSLVNIHSYFIRMVRVKYWGNNLDIFERSPGRAWGAARIPSFKPEPEGRWYWALPFSFLHVLSLPSSSMQAWHAVLSETGGRDGGRGSSGPVEGREADITWAYWTEPAHLRYRDISTQTLGPNSWYFDLYSITY